MRLHVLLATEHIQLLLQSCGTAESIHDIPEILHNDLEVKVREGGTWMAKLNCFFFFSEGSHDDTKPGFSQAVLAYSSHNHGIHRREMKIVYRSLPFHIPFSLTVYC